MSLDLGELVTRIGMDLAPLRRDKEAAKTELRGVVSDSEAAGQDAGQGFAHNWGGSAQKGAVAAGAAFGIAVVAGLHGAMDREAAAAKMAVQLGLTPEQQARMGALAGRLYANAYGDSIDQVNESLVAAKSSLDGLDGHGLRRAARDALNFQDAFGTETGRSIQVVGQLIDQHLIKNPQQGFDLLFRSTQKIPAAVREDLLDAGDEYGQFFATLGYDGKQAFQVLVNESAKGMYGLDKAGDAIKEFTIRSTDMSTTTKQAYAAIGLNARDMADDILAGGDRAHDATQKIIQGLLDIEDPSKRANTALKLFGTPLEDLGVKDIPKFLQGLQDTGHQLDDVKGAAGRANRALSDTADADFTKLKRRLQNDLFGVMEKALPLVEDDLVPAIEGIGDALDDIPSWAVKGSIGGLLGLYAAGKLGGLVSNLRGLRGGGGVGGGVAGAIASRAEPLPVIVMNEGFGASGVGRRTGSTTTTAAGVPEDGNEDRRTRNRRRSGAGAGASLIAGVIGDELTHGKISEILTHPLRELAKEATFPFTYGEGDAFKGLNQSQAFLTNKAKADGSLYQGGNITLEDRQLPGMAKYPITIDPQLSTKAVDQALEGLPKQLQTDFIVNGIPDSKSKVKDLISQYDLTPSQMKTVFDQAGIPNSIREVQNLIAQQSGVPKDVTTEFHMNGIASVLQQIASLHAGINALPDVSDHVLPYAHGGGRSATGDSAGRKVTLRVGQRDFDAYVDERADDRVRRHQGAQDDWEDSLR